MFMVPARGQQPDHSKIAAFVLSIRGESLPVFRCVLLVREADGVKEMGVVVSQSAGFG